MIHRDQRRIPGKCDLTMTRFDPKFGADKYFFVRSSDCEPDCGNNHYVHIQSLFVDNLVKLKSDYMRCIKYYLKDVSMVLISV